MSNALKALLSLFGWIVPGYLADVLVGLLQGVIWVVGQVGTLKGMKGAEKLKAALELARGFVDEYLDAIPIWAELGEDRRDRILAGAVEWILFVELLISLPEDIGQEAADSGDARRARRKAAKRLRWRQWTGQRKGRRAEPANLADLKTKELRALAHAQGHRTKGTRRADLLHLLAGVDQ